MTMPIRLLLADDHPVVRAGLRAVLDTEPDFHVAAEPPPRSRPWPWPRPASSTSS